MLQHGGTACMDRLMQGLEQGGLSSKLEVANFAFQQTNNNMCSCSKK